MCQAFLTLKRLVIFLHRKIVFTAIINNYILRKKYRLLFLRNRYIKKIFVIKSSRNLNECVYYWKNSCYHDAKTRNNRSVRAASYILEISKHIPCSWGLGLGHANSFVFLINIKNDIKLTM